MKDFKNFNFKLMVVQELMYNKKLLTPIFDVYEFAETDAGKNIDTEKIDYQMIPEVRSFFEALDIPDDLLSTVTELNADGGDDIYLQLCPQWDGEDDLFNVKSAADCGALKNLKSVTLLYDDDPSILEDFRSCGIEADWL